MDAWPLQDAKNKLSGLVDRAIGGAPQMITRRGKPVAVVMSVAEYEKNHAEPAPDFIEFLLNLPKMPDAWFADGADPFARIQGNMRDVDW